MKISVSHNKPKQEVKAAVDRSFDGLLQGIALVPLKVENQQKSWSGSTLTFSLTARVGLISSPIKGTIEVKDTELIVDADLGFLEKIIGGSQTQNVLDKKLR